MIVKNCYGVVTKKDSDYILFSHEGELNLSKELKFFWQLDVPMDVEITSNLRRYALLHEDNCPIYYDRDRNRKYKLHINDINIEDMLERHIGQQLDITFKWESNGEREDTNYGGEIIHKS